MFSISRLAVMGLLLVGSARAAFAQAPADVPMTIMVDHLAANALVTVPAPPKRPRLLMGLYMGAGAWQAMDLYTTNRGIKAGAFETNDAIRTGNAGATLAMKLAMTGASIALAEKMWKKNKALAVATMVGNNLLTALVVANNYRVIRQLDGK